MTDLPYWCWMRHCLHRRPLQNPRMASLSRWTVHRYGSECCHPCHSRCQALRSAPAGAADWAVMARVARCHVHCRRWTVCCEYILYFLAFLFGLRRNTDIAVRRRVFLNASDQASSIFGAARTKSSMSWFLWLLLHIWSAC